MPITQSKLDYAKTDRTAATADLSAPALYVNYFEVGHNPFEFLMDLGQFHPGATERDGRFAIHTRIAIAPPFAKMLAALLTRAVEEHEGEHGQIPPIGPQATPFDIVLSSLGDFEARARALRARDRGGSLGSEGDLSHAAHDSAKSNRPRKGR